MAAKAAKDMDAILQAAHKKKHGALHANEMAALALTFHPVCSPSHTPPLISPPFL
jgi:hypothetical protein